MQNVIFDTRNASGTIQSLNLRPAPFEKKQFDFPSFLTRGKIHFNFLSSHRANLIAKLERPQRGKESRNLVAKYDNKLGQTSTRRGNFGRKTHRQVEEMDATEVIDRYPDVYITSG